MTSNNLILAEVLNVRDPHIYYHACKKCYSKVMLNDEGFVCLKCGRALDQKETQQRYRMCLQITDGLVKCNVTVFGKQLDAIMGCSADQFDRFLSTTSTQQVTSCLEESLNRTFCGKWFLFGFKNVQSSKKFSVSLKEIIQNQKDSSPIIAWQMTVCENKSDNRKTVIEDLQKTPVTLDQTVSENSLRFESPSYSFEQISLSGLHFSMDKSDFSSCGMELTLNQGLSDRSDTIPNSPIALMTKTSQHSIHRNQNITCRDFSIEMARGETLELTKCSNVSKIDCDETYDPAMRSCGMAIHSISLASPRRSLTFGPFETHRKASKIKGNGRISEILVSDDESMAEENFMLLAGNSLPKLQASVQDSNAESSRCLVLCNEPILSSGDDKVNAIKVNMSAKHSETMSEMPDSEDLEAFLADLEASESHQMSSNNNNTMSIVGGNDKMLDARSQSKGTDSYKKKSVIQTESEVNISDMECMTGDSVMMLALANLSNLLEGSNTAITTSSQSNLCNMSILPKSDESKIKTSEEKLLVKRTETEALSEMPFSEDLEAFLTDLDASESHQNPSYTSSINSQGSHTENVNCDADKLVKSSTKVSRKTDMLEEMPYSEDIDAFLKEINSFSYPTVSSKALKLRLDHSEARPNKVKEKADKAIIKAGCSAIRKEWQKDKHQNDDTSFEVVLAKEPNPSVNIASIVEEMPFSEDLDLFLADIDEPPPPTEGKMVARQSDVCLLKASPKKLTCQTVPADRSCDHSTLTQIGLLHVAPQLTCKNNCHVSCIESKTENVKLTAPNTSSQVQLGNRKKNHTCLQQDENTEPENKACTKPGDHEEVDINDGVYKNDLPSGKLRGDDKGGRDGRMKSVSLTMDSFSEDLFADCDESDIIPITPRIIKTYSVTNSSTCSTKTARLEESKSGKNTQKSVAIHMTPAALNVGTKRKPQRKSVNFALHLLQTRAIPKIDAKMLHTPSPVCGNHSKMKSCLTRNYESMDRSNKFLHKHIITINKDSEDHFTPSPLGVPIVRHSKQYQKNDLMTTERSDRLPLREIIASNADSEDLFTPSPLGLSVARHSKLYQSTPYLFDSSVSASEDSIVSCTKRTVCAVESDQNMSSELFSDVSLFSVSGLSEGISSKFPLPKKTTKTFDKPWQHVVSNNSSSQLNCSKGCDSIISQDLFSDDDSLDDRESICTNLFPV